MAFPCHAPFARTSLLTTPTPPPSPPNEPSLFLTLPAELRNEIYGLVLTTPYAPTLRKLSTRGHVSDYILPKLHLTPALLRTCRQIHSEAHSILYATNTFAAHPSLLSSLPYLVSPRRPVLTGAGLRKIRKWYVRVRLDVDPKFSAAEAEAAFSGAEELEIDVFQAMYGSCDFEVLRLFEGVRGVGTATVSCGTGCKDYAMWLQHVMMLPKDVEAEPYEEDSAWELWSKGGR